jgi:hypothetical protein
MGLHGESSATQTKIGAVRIPRRTSPWPTSGGGSDNRTARADTNQADGPGNSGPNTLAQIGGYSLAGAETKLESLGDLSGPSTRDVGLVRLAPCGCYCPEMTLGLGPVPSSGGQTAAEVRVFGAYPWRTSHSSWLGSRGELTRPESDERPCPLPGSAGAR